VPLGWLWRHLGHKIILYKKPKRGGAKPHPFFIMLHITKDSNSTLLFTGTEQCVLSNPYFLFIFTNTSTNTNVAYVGTDISPYPLRYNKVIIDGSLFKEVGYWTYEIYEQLSDSNTDPNGLNKVEEGFMVLSGADFNPDEYSSQDNTFITHG